MANSPEWQKQTNRRTNKQNTLKHKDITIYLVFEIANKLKRTSLGVCKMRAHRNEKHGAGIDVITMGINSIHQY